MERTTKIRLNGLLAGLALAACASGSDGPARVGDTRSAPESAEALPAAEPLFYRRDVTPIERVEDALPGTFIQPFERCSQPPPGASAAGQICANVAISGATEPGRRFAELADCAVVRRQRPYWPAPPARASKADDTRLADDAYLRESAWAAEQVAATGCSCCHDGRLIAASQWDIALGPLWLDSLSDTGLALFAGLADSSVLGAYPAAQNFGFDREATGIPTNDTPRMKAFLLAELSRRGLSEQWAREVPPFGGPIYTASTQAPERCAAGQGVDPDGRVHWTGGAARYVYLLAPGGANPGVPPNLDLPAGTLWRLDVLASAQALESGILFGATPKGSFQAFPESEPAAALEPSRAYQLVALRDVGLPLVNCTFTFGDEIAPAPAATDAPDAGAMLDGAWGPSSGSATPAMCALPGGDVRGFGAACNDTAAHSDCSCAANYCSKSPFDAQGYCSLTGCKENPGICPAGWTCFDVSAIAPGQPSVCARP